MKVKFLELAKSNKSQDYLKDFKSLLRDGQLMFGKKTAKLENIQNAFPKVQACTAT